MAQKITAHLMGPPVVSAGVMGAPAVSAGVGDVKYVALESLGGVMAGNVKSYGAVGDAIHHEMLGYFMEKSWGEYLVGHYKILVTKVQHAPYIRDQFYPELGESQYVTPLTVVENSAAPGKNEIRLSDVKPYPMYTGKQGQFTHGAPAVGDKVVEFTVADNELSTPATDDSLAFLKTIAACDGVLYLPEGDYVVSQQVAEGIKALYGVGRVWIREWQGGVLYYLMSGTSKRLRNLNFGWADPVNFQSPAWRSMHWVEAAKSKRLEEEISSPTEGRISPICQYAVDSRRKAINTWFWISPTVEEEDFPDEVTVCFSKNTSAGYTYSGDYSWHRSSPGGLEHGYFLYSDYTGEETLPVDTSQYYADLGDWVEIRLPKTLMFYRENGGAVTKTNLHAWTPQAPSELDWQENLPGCNVGYGKVWIKNPEHSGLLECTMGQDMRTSWSDYQQSGSYDDYCHEAFITEPRLLSGAPLEIYGYYVPEDLFSSYLDAGQCERIKGKADPFGSVGISYNALEDLPGKAMETVTLAEGTFTVSSPNSPILIATLPMGKWVMGNFETSRTYILEIQNERYILKGTGTDLMINTDGIYLRIYRTWSEEDSCHYIYMECSVPKEYTLSLREYEVKTLDELLLPESAVITTKKGMLDYNSLSQVPCRLEKTAELVNGEFTVSSDGNTDLGAMPEGFGWWRLEHIYCLTVNDTPVWCEPTSTPDGGVTMGVMGGYTVWIDFQQGHVFAWLPSGSYHISLVEYAYKRLDSLLMPENVMDSLESLSQSVTELQATVSGLTGSVVGGTYKLTSSKAVTTGTANYITVDVSQVSQSDRVIIRISHDGCLDTTGNVWIQYLAVNSGGETELIWVNYYTSYETALPAGTTALKVNLPNDAIISPGMVTMEVIVLGVEQ